MRSLWLYDFVSRARWLNYRGKIMLMAFAGTHIPLLAIIIYFVSTHVTDFWTGMAIVLVALVATLAGTAATLFVLDHLLRPMLATSKALRRYRLERVMPDLPTTYRDEAGTLMADAMHTLRELDTAIDQLANYDGVTGLANRDGLLAEMRARIGRDASFVLCAVKLEGYERLVATFDQTTADAVLLRLTAALKDLAANVAFLARVEAGTFAAVFDTQDDLDALSTAIGDALASLRDEIVIGDVSIVPDLSVGVALSPQDGRDPEALLDNAVSAIGTVTLPGAPSVTFFSPVARESARARFLTEQELRRAIVNQEFCLHYQPAIDTRLGRAIGGEALIRWQHPERGLLGPGAFIPIAEASGLIDPIGRWVIHEAAGQLREWAAIGRDDLKIAINISAKQFRDPALFGLIEKAVSDNGLTAGRLEVELTETAAMHDRDHAATLFHRLRELGVSIAIDDFGTGYSSMSNLLDMPFDLLKIDRQFVSGVDRARKAQAICAALIALGKGLATEVLAEGVEREEEVQALRAMGVSQFQGFYFAKPLPADGFVQAVSDLRLTAELMQGADRRDALRLKLTA